jgi:non-ribosomal peptide synthetase component F
MAVRDYALAYRRYLVVGLIAVPFPEVWGNGYGATNEILGGQVPESLAADEHGAVLANYTDALSLLVDGKRVAGVRARDSQTGRDFEIAARMTVNATGAWLDPLSDKLFALHGAHPSSIVATLKGSSVDVSVSGTEKVELNQGAAQRNHIGVRLDPRAIDRGIQNHQIVPHQEFAGARGEAFFADPLCTVEP